MAGFIVTTILLHEISHLADEAKQRSRTDNTQFRKRLLHSINGDIFFPLSLWPFQYQSMFWQKPLSDRSTFQLMLFLIGNGCSIHVASSWIFSSLTYSSDIAVDDKRRTQLITILRSIHGRQNDCFYYDLFHRHLVYFNGNYKV